MIFLNPLKMIPNTSLDTYSSSLSIHNHALLRQWLE